MRSDTGGRKIPEVDNARESGLKTKERRMRLRGKLAVVTGASSGIGRAVALDLAQRGVAVALLARDPRRLDDVALRVSALGGRSLAVPVDVADETSVRAALRRVRDLLGEPDILVNAAGFAVWKPFAGIADAEHRRMMDVNYWGTWNCLRELLPGMRERGVGAIVNISGGGGKFAFAVTSGYSASKFAVTGLSESLYRELRGSGVQISCLHPGSVETPFWNEASTPRAGIPVLARYAPKMSPAAIARQVRYCLWFGFPVRTVPVFVGFLARANAMWIRLGDVLLWKWFLPALLALFLARVLLRTELFR
jgi:NAD(P)-dependent dehydrogenase (short-subunit alcohol dehydrogenase family)